MQRLEERDYFTDYKILKQPYQFSRRFAIMVRSGGLPARTI